MEIIHLILGKANPNRMNGVNKVVYQLATNQAAQQIPVQLWGITKDLSNNYEERNFDTSLFLQSKNPFQIDRELKKSILARKGKAVFHLHGGWIPVYASLSRFFRKHDIKYVITAHGAYNEVAMKKSALVKKIYFSLFEKHVLKFAKRIHAIGKSELDGLSKIGDFKQSFLSPYGFEVEKFSAVEKSQDPFVIGFVGRITVFTKGLDIILKAFQKLESKAEGIELWIIGEGEDLEDLKKLAGDWDLSHIKFLGAKYGEEKNDLIKRMNVFVHASRNEGMPSAVIEAASFGVPVIVSPETNIGEMVTDYNAGIMLKENTIEALHEAFQNTIEKPRNKLQEQANQAIEMVQNVFDWKKIVRNMDSLYA